MKILFDTNVILDVLLRREPWVSESTQVWQAVDEERIAGWITASSLTDVFYVVRRSSNLKAARESVLLCMKTFGICAVDRIALEHATSLPGNDFEDNLQIACAVLAELDGIVTRDKDGFRASPVPTFSSTELLTLLNPHQE